MKVCSECKRKKPLTAFSHHIGGQDGRNSQCKKCCSEWNRKYREEHLEQAKMYHANWYKEHLAHVSAYNTRYRAEHPKWAAAYSAHYRKKYPERESAAQAKWHKEHAKQKAASVRRRRARKRAVSENFTVEMGQLVRATWNNQCAFCGETSNLQVDHWVPLSKGHALTMANAVLLCRSCNARKGAKLPKELADQRQVAVVEQQLAEQAQQWLARGLVASFFAA